MITTELLQKRAEFGVFAYQTGSANWSNNTYAAEFMYNQYIQATRNADESFKSWDYAPVKYWPNGIDAANNTANPSYTATENGEQKLSFFAYAPYTPNVDGTTYADINAAQADGTKLKYPDDLLYGAYPTGLDQDNVFKTVAYDADPTTHGGVLGMTNWTATVDPWLNFYLNNASTKEGIDLLWGMRGQYQYDFTNKTANNVTPLGDDYNINLTKQTVNDKVRFLFKHALAKIGGSTRDPYSESGSWKGQPKQSGVMVVVDVDANSTNPNKGEDNQNVYFSSNFSNEITLVTLRDVKIRDANTYSLEGGGSTLTGADAYSNLNTWGWFNIATGKWENAGSKYTNTTPESSDTKAELNINSNEKNGDSDGGSETLPGINIKIKEVGVGAGKKPEPTLTGTTMKWDNTTATGNPVGVTTEPTPVYDNATDYPGIMLIPGANAQTLYVTVDYLVRTADRQLQKKYSEVEQIITNKVDLTGLEANKYYTLVIHLGLTSVKFEAIVADWARTSDATYNEDGTTNETETTDNMEGKSVWLPSNVVNAQTLALTTEKNTNKEVTIAGDKTSYNITLNNLVAGNNITITKDASSTGVASIKDSNATPVTITLGTAANVSDLTMPLVVELNANNTASMVNNTLTIVEKDANDVVISTTKITIHQAPGVLTLTAASPIASDAVSFTTTLTNAGGANVDFNATTLTITPTSVSPLLSAPSIAVNSDPSEKHIATATIPKNTTAKDVTYTVDLEQTGGLKATCQVIQSAGTIDIDMSSQPAEWTWNKGAKTLALPKTAVAITNTAVWSVKINGADRNGTDNIFTTNVSWLSIHPVTGKISVTANPLTTPRTAKIYITVDGVTQTIEVTQAGS